MEPTTAPFFEILLGLLTGIGLAAACGFRIFIPPLIISIAAKAGHLTLSDSFDWMATTPALVIFASATLLEILGYYVPFVDNLLDAVAAPSAVVAGSVVAASQVTDMSPLMTWSVAIIAGGGAAGLVQGLTTVARQFSSFATAGFGNPILSSIEAASSLVMTVLAIVVPFVAVFAVLLLVVFAIKKIFFRHKPAAAEAAAA